MEEIEINKLIQKMEKMEIELLIKQKECMQIILNDNHYIINYDEHYDYMEQIKIILMISYTNKRQYQCLKDGVIDTITSYMRQSSELKRYYHKLYNNEVIINKIIYNGRMGIKKNIRLILYEISNLFEYIDNSVSELQKFYDIHFYDGSEKFYL